MQRSISSLIARGASVNYKAIAGEMGGISALTLQTYPKVRKLVDEYLRSDHLYQLQQFALREEQLLRRMESAVIELEAMGKPFTRSELCQIVGKSNSGLSRYPRVNAFLKLKATRHHVFQRRRKQPEEEDLMQRVKEAVIDLTDSGEHVTRNGVERQGHISKGVLMWYPQVVLFLEQSGYKKRKPRSEREAELLNLVMEAIHICKNTGQPITQEKLSTMVGVGGAALRRYPQVGELMTQAASQDKQERQERRFQVRQEELSQQVVVALQQLRDQNRKITTRAVEKLVHYSGICSRYPKVRDLIESAIQT